MGEIETQPGADRLRHTDNTHWFHTHHSAEKRGDTGISAESSAADERGAAAGKTSGCGLGYSSGCSILRGKAPTRRRKLGDTGKRGRLREFQNGARNPTQFLSGKRQSVVEGWRLGAEWAGTPYSHPWEPRSGLQMPSVRDGRPFRCFGCSECKKRSPAVGTCVVPQTK